MNKPADGVLEILNQIGRGSYASVHKAFNRQTGEICAIKKIPVTSVYDNLISEIKIMSSCKCKNIVRFLTSTCSNTELSIVMEYCCGGSVKDVMRQLGRTLSQEQITVVLRDVLNGLDYLHSTEQIHRDVKAANILLNEDGVAKLGDFGVSERLGKSTRESSIIGTLLWLPPEVLNQARYDSMIDIWSLGITVIEMGDGQPPYSDLEEKAAMSEIKDLSKPAPTFRDTSLWSQSLLNFLSLCLEKDASRRKSARELLGHEIIRNSPSNNIIRSLVNELCSSAHKVAEQEKELYRMSECLLKESVSLYSKYKERRMKVIRVDQMTDSLNSVRNDFKELQDAMLVRDNKLSDLRAQLNEIFKLEREREDLTASLDSHQEYKSKILIELNKYRELQRRVKLRSLEGKSA